MVREVKVKSILNRHKKRDEWFFDDYSVNPYYGCSFNCIYCYIRGSRYGKCKSEKVAAKINAPEVLDRQLRNRARKREYGIIALSSSTEPYMHVEEKLELSRMILQKILKHKFPVEIVTKSKLVLRDLDVLERIDKAAILPADLAQSLGRGVIISFSISTLDERLAKILEPGAPSPKERLEVMLKCRQEGFLAGVNYIPVLPFLSDSEEDLDEMIGAAKDHGADYVLVGSLTLFGEDVNDCKMLYYKFLEKHFPELVPKYQNLYESSFAPGKRYEAKLAKIVEKLCEKHGIRNSIA
jgi:DNA repair photolyase